MNSLDELPRTTVMDIRWGKASDFPNVAIPLTLFNLIIPFTLKKHREETTRGSSASLSPDD